MSANTSEKTRDPYDGLRPWSAITHGIGAMLAVIGAVYLIIYSVSHGYRASYTAAFAVYSVTLIALYTASTLYHCLNTGVKGRIALRKFDHIMIYFLIAGTYAPLCVVALGGFLGTALLCTIWGLALVGSTINITWIKLPRLLTSGIYIAMGWIAVAAIYPLSKAMGFGVFWLILGGVMYTAGGVLYAVKWPGRNNPRFDCHEIFHVFIVLGSICHYIMMFYT